jgi:ParB family chromosome partitioning protein
VLAWIEEGKIAGGAARALCSDKIADPEALARRIIDEGLNVRQIEAISRGEDINKPKEEIEEPAENVDTQPAGEKPEAPAKPKPELSADMKNFESRLETFFGTKVQLNPSAAGKPEGTIVIKYYSMDDLTRIQEIMENR